MVEDELDLLLVCTVNLLKFDISKHNYHFLRRLTQ